MENPASSLWSTAWPRAWPVTRGEARNLGRGHRSRGGTLLLPHLLLCTHLGRGRSSGPHRHRTHPPPSPVVIPRGPGALKNVPPTGGQSPTPSPRGGNFSRFWTSSAPSRDAACARGGGETRRRIGVIPPAPAATRFLSKYPDCWGALACCCGEPAPVLGLSRGAAGGRTPHPHPQGSPGSGVARNWRLRQIHIR